MTEFTASLKTMSIAEMLELCMTCAAATVNARLDVKMVWECREKIQAMRREILTRCGAWEKAANADLTGAKDLAFELGADICSDHCDTDPYDPEQMAHCTWCDQATRLYQTLRDALEATVREPAEAASAVAEQDPNLWPAGGLQTAPEATTRPPAPPPAAPGAGRECWVQWDKGIPVDAVNDEETAGSPTIQKGEWVRMVEASPLVPARPMKLRADLSSWLGMHDLYIYRDGDREFNTTIEPELGKEIAYRINAFEAPPLDPKGPAEASEAEQSDSNPEPKGEPEPTSYLDQIGANSIQLEVNRRISENAEKSAAAGKEGGKA